MTAPPTITFAAGVYDRLVPIFTQQVQVKGVDLRTFPIDDPRVIFDRQRGDKPEFDVSEMSTSELLVRVSKGDRTFKAIPAMPSRVFRHGFIVVNSDRVKRPRDLEGKKIGVQLFTMTATIWIRGILRDEYGVNLNSCNWVEGEIHRPGTHGTPRTAEAQKVLPSNLRPNESGKSLDELLVLGEIDALIGADLPPSLGKVAHIQRLFPDYVAEEKAYFKRTGAFPIMHLIVVRRELADKYPCLTENLLAALEKSKSVAAERMRETNPLRYMLPWLQQHIEQTDETFGGDAWPYGMERNRKTLEMLARYIHEDGLVDRIIPLEELFS